MDLLGTDLAMRTPVREAIVPATLSLLAVVLPRYLDHDTLPPFIQAVRRRYQQMTAPLLPDGPA
jgi:hypothetical protein